ncbi:cation:proton antiporter [Tepiditoga spiralis]|uniref:Cation:proton antiporter n=1 Tax=Tepiditoga spiralis TaxID=2108365 RepID=A0A7G1G717_9BACT|nr:Na+/H+ antiporter subunit E [Tepiditoga spiralis]BBE30954.1 cation:proton antiporter [Tepiditoga spiralis]
MKRFLSVFLVTYAIWITLTGFTSEEFLVGAIVAFTVSFATKDYLKFSFDAGFIVKVLKFVFLYTPLFVYKMIISNLDVAIRVIQPVIPLNPGFVKIKSDLKGDFGNLALLNSITLTPGTLSIDYEDGYMYIHWIDVKGSSEEEYKKEISQPFEKILGGIFK